MAFILYFATFVALIVTTSGKPVKEVGGPIVPTETGPVETRALGDAGADLDTAESKVEHIEKKILKLFEKCMKHGGCLVGGYDYGDPYPIPYYGMGYDSQLYGGYGSTGLYGSGLAGYSLTTPMYGGGLYSGGFNSGFGGYATYGGLPSYGLYGVTFGGY